MSRGQPIRPVRERTETDRARDELNRYIMMRRYNENIVEAASKFYASFKSGSPLALLNSLGGLFASLEALSEAEELNG